jgi:hypothetical protein
MLELVVGVLVLSLVLILSVLGFLLLPLLLILGIFLRVLVALVLMVLAVWCVGKTTLILIGFLNRKK